MQLERPRSSGTLAGKGAALACTVLLAATLFGCDHATKAAATTSLAGGGPVSLLGDLVVLDDEKHGRVHLIWHGQRHVPGVDAGVTLRVEGTLSQQERRPVIFDPHYEILRNGGDG